MHLEHANKQWRAASFDWVPAPVSSPNLSGAEVKSAQHPESSIRAMALGLALRSGLKGWTRMDSRDVQRGRVVLWWWWGAVLARIMTRILTQILTHYPSQYLRGGGPGRGSGPRSIANHISAVAAVAAADRPGHCA